MGKHELSEVVRTRHEEGQDGKETYMDHKTACSGEAMRSVTNDGSDEIDVLKGARGHRVEATSFRHATSEQYREQGFPQSCHR